MAKKRYLIIAILAVALMLSACEKKESKTEEMQVSRVELKDTSFLDEMERKSINLEFKKTEVEPKVSNYNVESDLSNVKNLKDFGDFTDLQVKDLSENGFMIAETKNITSYEGKEEYQYDQIHQIYEDNEYKGIPSFVTTDSVTHIFHIFYDNFLRNLEKEELYPELKDFNQSLLATNIDLYNNLENEHLKELQLKNIAFLATGAKLSDIEMVEVPEEAEKIVEDELKKLRQKRKPHQILITSMLTTLS